MFEVLDSLLKAEGSSYSLDVLYGGLVMQIAIFDTKKNSAVNFYNFWLSKPWIRIQIGTVFILKCWPDLDSMVQI